MPEQVQRQLPEQGQRQRRDQENATESPREAADLRNEELDDSVACCLAEIDEVLAEAETERDQALREFREAARDDIELRVWQATYAHLGLSYSRDCCGIAQLYDQESEKWLT